MSYRNSMALNADWDVAVTTRDDDLKTITIACDHRMNYQLVRTGLVADKQGRAIENPLWINWMQFNSPLSNFQLLAPRIQALLSSFDHVESVNLQNGEYNIIGDRLSVTGICFRSDCETSNLVCVDL